jgi:hypothetical protein
MENLFYHFVDNLIRFTAAHSRGDGDNYALTIAVCLNSFPPLGTSPHLDYQSDISTVSAHPWEEVSLNQR